MLHGVQDNGVYTHALVVVRPDSGPDCPPEGLGRGVVLVPDVWNFLCLLRLGSRHSP